ncbi:MAG: hypothetical protein AAF282_00145 [Cyanobacteria bacterium P01_A01_bin.15]
MVQQIHSSRLGWYCLACRQNMPSLGTVTPQAVIPQETATPPLRD